MTVVENRVAEAARVLRLFADPTSRETLKTRWLAALDGIACEARRDAKPGDRSAAVQAIRAAIELTGVAPAQRHEVGVRDLSKLSDAELLAERDRVVRKLTEGGA